MDSAQSWIDTLARAAMAAFVCRDAGGAPVIVERTPEFLSQMNTLIGRLDERTLLLRLAEVWPPALGDGPLLVESGSPATWHCVVDSLGESTYLVLFSRTCEPGDDIEPFYTLVENFPDIISRHDRQLRHVYVNHAVDRAIAPLTRDDYIGKTHDEVGETQDFIDLFQGMHKQVFDTAEPVEREFDYPTPGGVLSFLLRLVPEFDVDGSVHTVLSTASDISEIKRLQRELEVLSATDELTGLLNRRSFCDRLDAELQRVSIGATVLSTLLLDIDNFKVINDGLGHAAGDAVLAAVGRVLADHTRPSDLAGRLGGDELCVALIDTGAQEAQPIAEAIRTAIADLGNDDDFPEVSVSIGLATADANDRCATDLIARVDRLMYQAKLAGKNLIATISSIP